MKLKNVVLLFLLVILSMTVLGQKKDTLKIYRFDQLEPFLHQKNDTTYIINFWATWCIPCRKELPDMEKIHRFYSGQPVKVLLVSLDFPTQIESDLVPFLKKNNITAEVVLLSDPNSNSWINKVDSTWSGSIPATLIYKNDFREFYEKELEFSSLIQLISKTI
jgi:thiol-disulfide isomerase/thioredoxin